MQHLEVYFRCCLQFFINFARDEISQNSLFVKNTLVKGLKNQWFKWVRSNDDKSFYRILGMRRSGNHAITNWLLGQLEGSAVFLDNMQQHEPVATPNKRIFPGFGKTNLLVSHEDRPLNDFFLNYNPSQFGHSKMKCSILILRDPYNWLASWYAWQDELGKRFREEEEFQNHTIELWKTYARLFLEWQEDSNQNSTEKRVALNYNQWTQDINYRKQLAIRLDLKFTDKGREKMSINGYGSSFDGMAYNGKASQLNVLERWKSFENDPNFMSLFDEEILELGQKVFPEIMFEAARP